NRIDVMQMSQRPARNRFFRVAVYALLVWFSLAAFAPVAQALAADPPAAENQPAAEEKPGFVWQVLQNLFNSRKLMEVLGQPEYVLAAFIALDVIVFTETGLLIGFFLPGDSLLVVAGVVAHGTQVAAAAAGDPASGWNLPLLLTTLCASAVVGDSVGYSIGYKTGPKIFNREKS